MTMPVDLPDEVARRVRAAASSRGVRPEQIVVEAIEAQLGHGAGSDEENPFASIRDELRGMAFDGSLREEIDAVVDDPELAVG